MALQSFFAQLFIKLQTRIQQKVPAIKWVDQDLGQLEWYEQRPSVAWPCVLIDFNSTTYDQMPGNEQWGNATFVLRLGFPAFSAANSATPQATKENGLQYYELEQLLYQAIQGYDADGLIQPATRLSAYTEKREGDNFRIRALVFNTTFQDDSATALISSVPGSLDLSFV